MIGRKEISKRRRFFSFFVAVIIVFSTMSICLNLQLSPVNADSAGSHSNGRLKVYGLNDHGSIRSPIQWKGTYQSTIDMSAITLIGLVIDQDNYDHTPGSIDIADCFSSYSYSAEDDFNRIISMELFDDGTVQKSIAAYRNEGTGDPYDILINQTAWSVRDKDWFIIQYRLINIKGSDITGVSVGLELSLSKDSNGVGGGVGGDSGDDVDGYDPVNAVYYVTDNGGTGTYFGFASAFVSDPITHYYSADYTAPYYNTSNPSDPDPKYYKNFYANETWLYERLHAPNTVVGATPGNRTSTVGWDGFDIPAGSSRTVTLVMAINDTFGSMITALEDARNYYYNYLSGFYITEFSDSDSVTPQIEVFNFGRGTTDLAGLEYSLSVNGGILTGTWSVAPLPMYEYAVFTRTGGPPINTEGDSIRLYENGIIIDEVSFGQEGVAPDPLTGESVARHYNDTKAEYTDYWLRNASTGPTFGVQNNVPPVDFNSELLLNEILFNPISPDDYFVELYLKSDLLNISGYRIVCDSEFIIPDGTELTSANPYFYLTQPMAPGFFIHMGPSGDNVYLYDNNGRLLDMAGWSSPHEQGETMYRYPDGNGTRDGFDDSSSIAAGWFFGYTQPPPPPSPGPPTGIHAKLTGSGKDVMIYWNASVDDGSGEDDVAGYTIYKSSTGVNGSYEFTSWIPANGSLSYNWTDKNAGDGDWSDYFYIVRANDTLDIEEQNINKVGKSVNYLVEDWNLMSVPLIQANTSIEYVLQTIEGNYTAIYAYHAGKSRPWLHSHKAKPQFFNDVIEINHIKGYYIDMLNPDHLVVAGRVPIVTQISLKVGWNLVGYPCLINKIRDDALFSIAGKYNIVEYYDTDIDKEVRLGPDDYMEPGLGYWIHATENCILII